MPNLQEHMLRVAAVASLICDNFNEPLPKEDIVTACLLHDMGNIIKSNLQYFPEFLEPEGLEYWQNVKNEYIKKYGNDEELAHKKIIAKLGVSEKVIALVDQISFPLCCSHKDNPDFAVKIVNYADWRVSPYGVVSYDERMDEAKKRYKFKESEEAERQILIKCGREMEKQIFSKCKIKPEDINDKTVAPTLLNLKNFVVK